MKLKQFVLIEVAAALENGEIPPVDIDELSFVLDSIHAESIWLDELLEAFPVDEDIEEILDLLLDPECRNALAAFGERSYERDFNEEVGRREYTASQAYYDGISNPDDVDYGDGYPVIVDDNHTPEDYTSEIGFHHI